MYLFELGRPLELQQPVQNYPLRNFKSSMILTTLSKLNSSDVFNKEELAVYTEALR